MRKMKDSGIAWIGEIPAEWKVMTIKYTSWLKGRIGWQGLKSTEFIDDGPFLITGTDFDHGMINWSTCAHITNERFEEDEDIHIEEDDLLITKDGTIGKVAIVKDCPRKVSLNSGVLLIRNNKIPYEDKYIYYVLLSDEFSLWYELSQPQNSTIRHLYQGQFYNFKFAFPPLDEQHRIAAFLDEKCAHIDAVIEKTRASIDEYKKLKQAVITRAVTKGIRQGRKMKDSGIEWIEEIPQEWRIIPLKYLCTAPITDGTHKTPTYTDKKSGSPFLSSKDITTGKIDWTRIKYITKELHEQLQREVAPKRGDILLAKNGTTGIAALVEEDIAFDIYVTLADIRPDTKQMLPQYMLNCINSELCKKQFDLNLLGIGVPNLHLNIIKETKVTVPPLLEQQEIASYLDAKTAAIDRLIAKKEQLVAEMESCKKSLIYEYVTGKKEAPISKSPAAACTDKRGATCL